MKKIFFPRLLFILLLIAGSSCFPFSVEQITGDDTEKTLKSQIDSIKSLYESINKNPIKTISRDSYNNILSVCLTLCEKLSVACPSGITIEREKYIELEVFFLMKNYKEYYNRFNTYCVLYPESRYMETLLLYKARLLYEEKKWDEALKILENIKDDNYEKKQRKLYIYLAKHDLNSFLNEQFLLEKNIIGSPAGKIKLKRYNSNEDISMDSLKGKVVLIHLWAPSSGTADQRLLNAINKIYWINMDNPTFLLVNVNLENSTKTPLPDSSLFLSGVNAFSEIQNFSQFGLSYFPSFILVAKNGRIKVKSPAVFSFQKFDAVYLNGWIRCLLAEKPDNKETEGNHARLFEMKGSIYFQMKNLDSAMSFYEKSIQLNPNNINLLVELGRYYQNKQNFDNAHKYFEACYNLFRENEKLGLISSSNMNPFIAISMHSYFLQSPGKYPEEISYLDLLIKEFSQITQNRKEQKP